MHPPWRGDPPPPSLLLLLLGSPRAAGGFAHGGVVVFWALIQNRWGEGGFGHSPAPAAHVLPDTWINPFLACTLAKLSSRAARMPKPATWLHLQTFYYYFLHLLDQRNPPNPWWGSESKPGLQPEVRSSQRSLWSTHSSQNLCKKNPTHILKEHQFAPQSNCSLLQTTSPMLSVKDDNVQPQEGETSSLRSP